MECEFVVVTVHHRLLKTQKRDVAGDIVVMVLRNLTRKNGIWDGSTRANTSKIHDDFRWTAGVQAEHLGDGRDEECLSFKQPVLLRLVSNQMTVHERHNGCGQVDDAWG